MKKQLRTQFGKLRNSISAQDAKTFSQQMTHALKNLSDIQHADVIASFVSFKSEIDTTAFNQWVIDANKILLLPKVDHSKNEIRFLQVTSLESLKQGAYGILEPDEILCKPYDPKHIEVVITPGLAFDVLGYRLGYGGGYYDRLFNLSTVKAMRIGVGYDLQFTDALPHEVFDLPVHYFVSEAQIKTFK